MRKILILLIASIILFPTVTSLSYTYTRKGNIFHFTTNEVNNVTAYKWDVGNDLTTGWITNVSYGKEFWYTFLHNGTYPVTLYVRYDNGSTSSYTRYFTINRNLKNITVSNASMQTTGYVEPTTTTVERITYAILKLNKTQLYVLLTIGFLTLFCLYVMYKNKRKR